jgi:ornithine--oxo-acid transaminase
MTNTTHLPAGPHTRLTIISAASALGAPHPGPAAAAQSLRSNGLTERLSNAGIKAEWADVVRPTQPAADTKDMTARLEASAAFARRLADRLATLDPDAFPLILGGDHAIAAGTWRGIGRRAGGAPGLIWIDAHLDSHTAESTHSGNIHGMPLAALLGEGDRSLVGIPGPRLDPARVCVIGARAWETEEHERPPCSAMH